jgi:hypothetical protein
MMTDLDGVGIGDLMTIEECASEIGRLLAENAKLREGYAECVIDLQDWATYAPEYFKEKHGLDECVAEHKAALEVGDEHV